MDNGTAFVAALNWLADRYGIRHIQHATHTLSELSDASTVPENPLSRHAKATFLSGLPLFHTLSGQTALQLGSQPDTPPSSWHMARNPFSLSISPSQPSSFAKPLSTTELIAIRVHQLQKREADLATIHANVLRSRFEFVQQFDHQYEKTIRDYDFKPGTLVLVRNSSIETDLGRKSKPHYFLAPWSTSAEPQMDRTAWLSSTAPS